MKKLLVLGGAEKSLPLVRHAQARGHGVVLCDRDPQNPCRELADDFIELSTVDHARIVEAVSPQGVQGVVSFGSDVNAVSAARIAAALGLPGNPPDSVVAMVRKDRFREFLAGHGFAAPMSASFASAHEVDPRGQPMRLPVIVKPVDGAGSAGVSKLAEWSGLDAAFARALEASRERRAVVEEFIDRRHPHMIGGDVFVMDGQVRFWGLLNSHRACASSPFLPTGTSFPIALDDRDRQAVMATIQRLVSALGIRFGGLNVELMFDQDGRLFVIELAPRNGGNQIPELLRMATGVDLIGALVDAALGEPVDLTPRPEPAFVANYMLHSPRAGLFREVTLSDTILPFVVDQVLSVTSGDQVRAFERATDSLGTLSLRFPSAEQQQAALSRISDLVSVAVDSN